VYGTLLPGQPNFYLWEAHISSLATAVLPHGRLYDIGSYPMLIETRGETVTGKVVTLKAATYEAVMTTLDSLEGYFPDRPAESDYLRVAREVILENDTAVNAWVYVGQSQFVQNLPLVKNGDWRTHIQHKHQQIE